MCHIQNIVITFYSFLLNRQVSPISLACLFVLIESAIMHIVRVINFINIVKSLIPNSSIFSSDGSLIRSLKLYLAVSLTESPFIVLIESAIIQLFAISPSTFISVILFIFIPKSLIPNSSIFSSRWILNKIFKIMSSSFFN